jgi:hypothetical protein
MVWHGAEIFTLAETVSGLCRGYSYLRRKIPSQDERGAKLELWKADAGFIQSSARDWMKASTSSTV